MDRAKLVHQTPAQHGIPADRFARKIIGIFQLSYAARSRQLNAKPLGRMWLVNKFDGGVIR